MSDPDSPDLARDLFERLAASMPDNPQRATAVQRRVRRRHRRRVATRATIGLACVAGVGGVLVVGTSKRAEPLTAAAPGETKATTAPTTTPPSQDACQLKAAAVAGSAAATTIPSTDGHFKGTGTVTAIDGDVISVAIHDATIPLTRMTATIAPDARYTSARADLATRPVISVGQQVAFGAIAEPDGSYVIDLLEVPPVDADSGTPGASAKNGSASTAPTRLGRAEPGLR